MKEELLNLRNTVNQLKIRRDQLIMENRMLKEQCEIFERKMNELDAVILITIEDAKRNGHEFDLLEERRSLVFAS